MRAVAAIALVLMAPSIGAQATTEPLAVLSDPKAKYWVLERGGKGDLRTIMTKRTGPSGTSYSIREYDCKNGTVRYLGTGETLEEARVLRPDKKRAPVVPGSIADYVGGAACPYKKLRPQR